LTKDHRWVGVRVEGGNELLQQMQWDCEERVQHMPGHVLIVHAEIR
jgi:hypothetical protein